MSKPNKNNYLLEAGRFGLPVLSQHLLHSVARIHQHYGKLIDQNILRN